MQVRTVELSNPTDKAISYSARLEGHADFSIEAPSLRLAPKSKILCQVNCTPSAGLPQEADLILTSKRDGAVFAATLVFHLRSSVKTRSPLKRVKVEKALYELKTFEFTLVNPFPAECEFVITLVHEKAEPPDTADDAQAKGTQKGGKGKKAAPAIQVCPSYACSSAMQCRAHCASSSGRCRSMGPANLPTAMPP